MARLFTTGFEEPTGALPRRAVPTVGANYYDPTFPLRDFDSGRTGQAIEGTRASKTVGLVTTTTDVVLPIPPGGHEGGPPGASAWTYGVPVSPGVAVITRLYAHVAALPAAQHTFLDAGLVAWASSQYDVTQYLEILLEPDGSIGFTLATATPGEVAAAIANASMPGSSATFPWGSGTLTAGSWECLEFAMRYGPAGSGKGYAAMRLNGVLISEAPCVTLPWVNLGNAGSPTHFGFRTNGGGAVKLFDDIAINDETGGSDNTWPGPDTGIYFGGSHPGCLSDPAGSGYYDCGLAAQDPLGATCPSKLMCVL